MGVPVKVSPLADLSSAYKRTSLQQYSTNYNCKKLYCTGTCLNYVCVFAREILINSFLYDF